MFDGVDRSARIFLLDPGNWATFKDRVRPYIGRMAEGSDGRFLPEDIEACIFAGRFHAWLILVGSEIGALLMTEIVDYPQYRALRCIGIVGHRSRRWMHLLANVEQAARQWPNGPCARIEAFHQPGHERLLRTGGWKSWHLMSEKTL